MSAVPLVIGLTGGVASGKSSVAQLLRAAGVPVIDLDRIGRELTEKSPLVREQIAKICGTEVLAGGALDRKRVRETIFSDPAARKKVEALLHPLIWEEFLRQKDAAARVGARLVVCEAALLIETGLDKKLDGLILVTAPEEARLSRVVQRDQISAVLAGKMLRSQLQETEGRKSASIFIENQGSLADLALRVQELVDTWRTKGLLG